MKIITAVIGASPNGYRYSNKAVNSLLDYGFEVIPLGIRKGKIAGGGPLKFLLQCKRIASCKTFI